MSQFQIRLSGDPSSIKTPIICTLAPDKVSNAQQIERYYQAGMRIVRLNFSHFVTFSDQEKALRDELMKLQDRSAADDAQLNQLNKNYERRRERAWDLIELVREAEKHIHRPIGIMMDLCGPRLRTHDVAPGVKLVDGQQFRFVSDVIVGDSNQCSIYSNDYEDGCGFVSDLQNTLSENPEFSKENPLSIYIEDGSIKLNVLTFSSSDVQCIIESWTFAGFRHCRETI